MFSSVCMKKRKIFSPHSHFSEINCCSRFRTELVLLFLPKHTTYIVSTMYKERKHLLLLSNSILIQFQSIESISISGSFSNGISNWVVWYYVLITKRKIVMKYSVKLVFSLPIKSEIHFRVFSVSFFFSRLKNLKNFILNTVIIAVIIPI